MNVRLVRHATLLLDTSVGRVLVDPMLRAKETSPPIENTPKQRPNPLVDLPMPVDEVLDGVDLCIVTHLHRDHFDDLIPLDLPILTQPESAGELRARGHTNVTTEHPAIPMTRGRHGTGEIGAAMGAVSGWVVDGVYIAGDTILCDEVHDALARHEPRAIVVNAGGARVLEGDPITMTAAEARVEQQRRVSDELNLHEARPSSTQPLWPPRPIAFESATSTCVSRASFGT